MARLLAAGLVAGLLAGACAGPRAITRPEGPPVPAVIGAEQRGLASWYGEPYHGRRAASGEIYDMHRLTAAHRTLPFGTWLRVESLGSGRTVELRVNDRGPFVDGRVLDVSYAAGQALGMIGPGVVPVRLEVIAPPARSRAPAAAPAGGFAVQVGAFTEEARARALQQALADAGVQTRVHRADEGFRTLYRVRAGPFGSQQEAHDQATRLSSVLGRDVIVVPE